VLIAEAVQSQLREIGVEVTIQKVESATFWDGLKVPKNKVDFDMVLFGYNPSHGDGYIHMDALYGTNPSEDAAPPQWNFNWYNNSEVDDLLKQARQSVDLEQRTRLLGQAEQIVWNDAPYLWLFAKNILTAHRTEAADAVNVLPVVFTLVHGDK
jgi:ABC-type transport system substrate-binding protein